MCYDDDVKITLYADDTVIYSRSGNMLNIHLKNQQTLHNVSAWCLKNHINLNVKKTKPCYYGIRRLLPKENLELRLNGVALHSCTQYKYLGVLLDETMNMESNFNYIFKRLSYKFFQFTKIIRNYLDIKTRVLVYKQTIMPLAEYAGFMFNLNRKQDIDKLQKLQNRLLRLCFNIHNPRDLSVTELHIRANIDTLNIRRELQLLGLMYDVSSNLSYILAPRANTRQADGTAFATDIV